MQPCRSQLTDVLIKIPEKENLLRAGCCRITEEEVKKMQKKIKGIIFIVVSIVLIARAKALEVPALISVLLVLAALALFIYALPAFISRAESSGEKQVASSDKH